ncbi:MAG: hypothetical protein U1F43_01085 [Myxococcota bacterium]
MTRSHIVILLAATALVSGGGICGPDPGPNPCDTDRLGCDDGPTDWTVQQCPGVDEPLEVELAHGEDGAFHEVAPNDTPLVHYGLQGGQHVFLGVRVPNARLDVYGKLRVTFWMGMGEGCTLPATPSDVPPPACTTVLGRRQVILGARTPLHTDADGAVQELGILMFLTQGPPLGAPVAVAAQVEDPCGRVGMAGLAYVVSN